MDLGASALGLLVGVLPIFLIYLVGGAGGGDVKLMAGVGAFGGAIFSLSTLFWSLVLGSLMGIVQAAWTGELKGILQRVLFTLFHSVLPGIGPISHMDKQGPTIHFGVAISLGAWISLVGGIPQDIF
jgi:prepilin peptidase CpaA